VLSSMIFSRTVFVLDAAARACSKAVLCQEACVSEDEGEGPLKTYGR
jgi:hypothetical protein